ncbi:hypothetical protein SOVF_192010 isoform C, partial [Spinacia oleracea]
LVLLESNRKTRSFQASLSILSQGPGRPNVNSSGEIKKLKFMAYAVWKCANGVKIFSYCVKLRFRYAGWIFWNIFMALYGFLMLLGFSCRTD